MDIVANPESTFHKTTPEQRKSIQEGREQIERGEFFTDEEVKKEMDKWLKE
jgi:predicted transcriptional regulator